MARHHFRSQAAHAYETLRRWILTRKLPPGTRISVRETAAELGTSNGPVRDALIQLSNEQLIEGGHGQEWSVSRVTRDMIDGGMAVREALEVQSARLAALRATSDDISSLRRLAEEIDSRVKSGLASDDITTELDGRFHISIASLSGSPQLVQEIERWKVVMDWARMFMGNRVAPGRGESHVAVVDAIATGDPEAAERQMRQHVLHPWQEQKWAAGGEEQNDLATADAGKGVNSETGRRGRGRPRSRPVPSEGNPER